MRAERRGHGSGGDSTWQAAVAARCTEEAAQPTQAAGPSARSERWSAARLPSGAGDVAGAERDHDRRGGGDGGAGEVGAGGGPGGPGGCSGSVGAGRF